MNLPRIVACLPKKVIRAISKGDALNYGCIPLSDKGIVVVCVENTRSGRWRAELVDFLRTSSRRIVRVSDYSLTGEEMDATLDKYYS